MPSDGYNQFCPLAKACEILEPRWTLLILSEIWSGSARFNDIGRGVPGLSPTLLSRRLKDLEAHGLVQREQTASGQVLYRATAASLKLQPVVQALGQWAYDNIDSDVTLQSLDSRLLMWNMRRKIDTGLFPDRRSVVQFIFPEQAPVMRNYWLIARPHCQADLCLVDPGFEVDLFVEADLRTMTSVYMGFQSLRDSISEGMIYLSGDKALAGSIDSWLRLSSYAGPRETPRRTPGHAGAGH